MPDLRAPSDHATSGVDPAHDAQQAPASAPEPSSAGIAERRIQELERRVHDAERERDELVRALAEAREANDAKEAKEAKDAQHAAERALRERDEIFGAVIHELRNPLGTIMLAATALLEPESTTDPRTQRIRTIGERIHRQAERMNHQLTNLADFAELQAGQLALHREPHAPAELVAVAAAQLAPLAQERGIRFDVQVASGLPTVAGDQERIVQVMWNLVTTAIKGTPRGGAIEIGAEACGSDPVFFLREPGRCVDPDELNAIFGPPRPDVRQRKRAVLLGFQIARRLVEAHGGIMWAHSKPEVGTTVCFTVAPPSQLTEQDRSSSITDVCPPAL